VFRARHLEALQGVFLQALKLRAAIARLFSGSLGPTLLNMGASCSDEISAEHTPRLARHYLRRCPVDVVLRKPSMNEIICRFDKPLRKHTRIVAVFALQRVFSALLYRFAQAFKPCDRVYKSPRNNHMATFNASSLSIIAGRFLLGLYFLAPGISKITDPESQLMLMEARDIPNAYPLLVFAGVSSLLGAAALMSGRYVKLAAYGFVAYVLLVNVLIHPFWIVEAETQNFVKNLAIMSGLLVLAGQAQFRWPSPSNWWKSDAAVLKS
jgi:putative oxidoreductase